MTGSRAYGLSRLFRPVINNLRYMRQSSTYQTTASIQHVLVILAHESHSTSHDLITSLIAIRPLSGHCDMNTVSTQYVIPQMEDLDSERTFANFQGPKSFSSPY